MTVAYQEAFPAGYLLVLAPGGNSDATFAHHLDGACRSGKPAVWVDCRLLDTVSATAIWLLWACQRRLQRRQTQLVFCNVSQRLDRALRRIFTCADLCIVPSLDDVVVPSQSI
jgi:anti-anti-sigma regulatory factor